MTRIGVGYDVHKLDAGEDLYIGGIKIPSNVGSVGHSDGDALCHAIVDALLGAAGLGDIGKYFPSSDDSWKDVKSSVFLIDALFKILDKISIKEFQKFDKNITKEVFKVLSPLNSMKSKSSFGGTSPETVKKSIQYAIKKYL